MVGSEPPALRRGGRPADLTQDWVRAASGLAWGKLAVWGTCGCTSTDCPPSWPVPAEALQDQVLKGSGRPHGRRFTHTMGVSAHQPPDLPAGDRAGTPAGWGAAAGPWTWPRALRRVRPGNPGPQVTRVPMFWTPRPLAHPSAGRRPPSCPPSAPRHVLGGRTWGRRGLLT